MPRVTSRYDLRNRRTARIKADGSTDLFRYDPADQVTAAAYGQSNVASASAESPPNGAAADSNLKPETLNFEPSQTFSYDPAGNRLEVTDNGMTTKYQPNAANQYEQIVTGTEIVEPDFDPNGNLLHDDRNTYTWDADIHLLSVTTKPQAGEKGEVKSEKGASVASKTTVNQSQQASTTVNFKYDALHRRIARLENNTQLTLFVMDGWNVITEHSSAIANRPSPISNPPRLSARHTWGEDLSGTLQGAGGIGGLLSSVQQPSAIVNNGKQSSTVPLWFHYDSNGNVILLTDTTAQPSARYIYDAFGQTMSATGIAAGLNRYRFSTKPNEGNSGLAYFGYRHYDPVSGRWPSIDPMLEFGGLNLYRMSNNSVLSLTDMLGTTPYSWSTPIYDYLTGYPIRIGSLLVDADIDCDKCEVDDAKAQITGLNLSGSIGGVNVGVGSTTSVVSKDASKVDCQDAGSSSSSSSGCDSSETHETSPQKKCQYSVSVRYQLVTLIYTHEGNVYTYSGECPCKSSN